MFGRLVQIRSDKDKPSFKFVLTKHASESSRFLKVLWLDYKVGGIKKKKKKGEIDSCEVVVELKWRNVGQFGSVGL